MLVCPSVSTPLSCAFGGGTPMRKAGGGEANARLLRLANSAFAEAIIGGALSGMDFLVLLLGCGSCKCTKNHIESLGDGMFYITELLFSTMLNAVQLRQNFSVKVSGAGSPRRTIEGLSQSNSSSSSSSSSRISFSASRFVSSNLCCCAADSMVSECLLRFAGLSSY